MIRVLLADDHRVVRVGLQQLLSNAPDVEVVGMAADGGEAVSMSAECEPDVVLMDLNMPVVDGIQAIRRLRAIRPGIRIVVLTSFSDRTRILDAIDAGAVGYLLKDCEPEELLRSIRAAAEGGSPLAPKAAQVVLEDRAATQRPGEGLSEREYEVLALLSAGLTNRQIARRLNIKEKTVKAHLTSVYRAIGALDRTQAALWAVRHGVPDGNGCETERSAPPAGVGSY